MKVFRQAAQVRPRNRPLCLAIGVFDGVHLGHQQVIRQAVADAEQHEGRAVVVTFDRHPAAVLAPARVPPLIHCLPQKLRAIGELGADAVLLIHFDRRFSRQTGEAFVRRLVRDLPGPIHSVCVGSAFTFGHQRSGNVKLLQRLGRELGFAVQGLAAVALDGRTVSSTRIREAIGAGDLDAAQQMLGREYALSGRVVAGDRLGRRLGFPTANLETGGLVLPPAGVYAVHVALKGVAHRAVLNIGTRPTLDSARPVLRVEAHLLDFKGNLYGREAEITFVQKLREERKFPSLEALREQITRDLAQARLAFAGLPGAGTTRPASRRSRRTAAAG